MRVLVVLSLGLGVAYARVHLGYHTAPQVIVGMGVGMCVGVGWFLCAKRLLPLMRPWMHQAPLWRWLNVRVRECIVHMCSVHVCVWIHLISFFSALTITPQDSSHIEDVHAVEAELCRTYTEEKGEKGHAA